MLRYLIVAAVCACSMLSSPRAALAQARNQGLSSGREPAGYKEAISSAVAEFERNNYEEAREHFARAHALFPNARSLRGMGMTEFELKNYVDAVGYLEQALSSDVKRLEARLRDETVALLASAKHYVGTVRFHLEPPSAAVSVDGIPVTLDEQSSLGLEIGDHLLEFRADGRLSERRAIKARGEQVLELTVKLAPVLLARGTERFDAGHGGSAEKSATSLPSTPTPTEQTPVYRSWWLWTTVGLAAAGGAVAAVMLTRKTHRTEEPTTTANTPPDGAFQPLWSR